MEVPIEESNPLMEGYYRGNVSVLVAVFYE
jgi:hypothetical protein